MPSGSPWVLYATFQAVLLRPLLRRSHLADGDTLHFYLVGTVLPLKSMFDFCLQIGKQSQNLKSRSTDSKGFIDKQENSDKTKIVCKHCFYFANAGSTTKIHSFGSASQYTLNAVKHIRLVRLVM